MNYQTLVTCYLPLRLIRRHCITPHHNRIRGRVLALVFIFIRRAVLRLPLMPELLGVQAVIMPAQLQQPGVRSLLRDARIRFVRMKFFYLNGLTIFKSPRTTSPSCISSE